MRSETLKAALISVLLFLLAIGAWHVATLPKEKAAQSGVDAEYAALMGAGAQKSGGFPPPSEVGKAFVHYLSDPFYDRGPNDKGIAIQLGHSLARVGLGFVLAIVVAIPLGFVIGMSPLLMKALDPFIQVLKPISTRSASSTSSRKKSGMAIHAVPSACRPSSSRRIPTPSRRSIVPC